MGRVSGGVGCLDGSRDNGMDGSASISVSMASLENDSSGLGGEDED